MTPQRDFSFRAWDTKSKRMEYFGLWPLLVDAIEGGKKDFWPTQYGLSRKYGTFANLELMRHTGLQDRNGKEIYEGDVVRVKQAKGILHRPLPLIGEIVYGHAAFGVRHKDDHLNLATWLAWCEPDIEIIGNIYENPELVK